MDQGAKMIKILVKLTSSKLVNVRKRFSENKVLVKLTRAKIGQVTKLGFDKNVLRIRPNDWTIFFVNCFSHFWNLTCFTKLMCGLLRLKSSFSKFPSKFLF